MNNTQLNTFSPTNWSQIPRLTASTAFLEKRWRQVTAGPGGGWLAQAEAALLVDEGVMLERKDQKIAEI